MKKNRVLIIGAGIAGPALAIQLVKRGFEIRIIESRKETEMEEGLFMGISPNGLNIMTQLVDKNKIYEEFCPGSLEFLNANGRKIAELNTDDQIEQFGIQSIQVKRAHINQLLRSKLSEFNIFINFDTKLLGLENMGDSLFAKTESGLLGPFDFAVGADGIHSATRRLIFPDAPLPVFTNQYSTGSITKNGNMTEPLKAMQMTFGIRAFFGYALSNTNELWWFNNFDFDELPEETTKIKLGQDQLKKRLLELHSDDHSTIRTLISKSETIFAYPIYEMKPLPVWHNKQVVLLGDAAHAVTPHTGQGASLALEDTAILVRCLSKYDTLEIAFKKFQSLREDRVKKIIKQARKVGNSKSAPNPFAILFRDAFLKYFINLEKKKMKWVYSYQPDLISV